MDKKIYAAIICICASVFLAAGNLTAQEDPKIAAKRAALMEKAKQVLLAREWIVYVMVKPATQKAPAVVETDSFVFTDRTVLSRNLSAQGYSKSGSNYSLWVADDGGITWETMQFDQDTQNIAFLRGEVHDGAMTGAVTYKPVKGKSETHPYSTMAPK